MTALHQFGAEMLKLSRGLNAVSSLVTPPMSSSTCAIDTDPETTETAMQQMPLMASSNRDLPARLSRERNRYGFYIFFHLSIYVHLIFFHLTYFVARMLLMCSISACCGSC